MKLEFSVQIFEKTLKYQIALESVQWEPCCYTRKDRRTDMKTLTVACCNFATVPKNTCSFAKLLHNEGETRKRIKNRLRNYTMNVCLYRSYTNKDSDSNSIKHVRREQGG